ncbi:hypothetical protein [Falsirhodobacter sp. alg1]|uniref:hypothetical protein n=1 Tax=Falsirhodobacter sp. alg1 TaxID=1472418 RepID=UPI0005EE1235|nr:hypothetical protein [Falsirhodobacter sp. alg1]
MPTPNFSVIARTIAILTLGYLVISAAEVSDLHLFFKEGHGVEEASLGMLVGSICLWFWLAGPYRWSEWQIPAVMLLMLAREMDADKRFTEHGLLKLTTYTHPAPLADKLIGGAAILFVLYVSYRLIRRNGPLWWARLRMMRLDAVLITIAFICGVFAKTFDGLGRKLAPMGIDISVQLNDLAGQGEEVLELACYWLIAVAIARLATPEFRRNVVMDHVPAE